MAPPDQGNQIVRRTVRVTGRVQGVFFRQTVRDAATTAGVGGWVANRPDGSVEAAFEGVADAVNRMVALCRVGPPAALVDQIEIREEPAAGATVFVIR